MIQDKLNSLRPYVTGLRFVKDLPVVDLVIKEGWNMFESDKVSYKPSANNKNYFMVFPKDPKDSIDDVVIHVENIISVNSYEIGSGHQNTIDIITFYIIFFSYKHSMH